MKFQYVQFKFRRYHMKIHVESNVAGANNHARFTYRRRNCRRFFLFLLSLFRLSSRELIHTHTVPRFTVSAQFPYASYLASAQIAALLRSKRAVFPPIAICGTCLSIRVRAERVKVSVHGDLAQSCARERYLVPAIRMTHSRY